MVFKVCITAAKDWKQG